MSRRGPKLNFSDDSSGDETEFGMENMNTEERKHLFTEGSRKCRPLTRNEKFCLVGGLIAVVVVVLLFVLIGVFSLSRGSSAAEPWKNVRLPESLRPLNYVLNLQVNMETFAVSGNVIIATEIVNSTQYVILHAKDMDIGSHSVKKDDENLNVKSYFFYPENDFYVMELSSQVGDGTLEVELSFNYTLREDLVGFYKSSYTFSEDTRYLATTQFEPTDARRAFPCFDEPAMKANFTTSIEHACEYTATSNMPISDETKCENNLKTTSFRPSVKMSTYLVAFVVSEFAYKNGTTKTGVEVKVWANPAVIGKTDYALEVAITVLEYYDTYFNVPYPLPKQDLFAIPDFAAGAMENWGLITYRETALLYEEGKDPATSKQRVAVVIAHELAHQWFGNLVTMAWWDGLWLNEGFASYVEYIGTNESNPDFAMADQFFTDAVLSAFSADGLNESHPIIQVVNDPNEINSLFDSISYDKGASLIRMLKDFLGEEHFLQGLTYYLNRYKFGNAETVDLWNALQETAPQSEVTISALMDTWTKQMGYPVLTVTRDGGGGEITVKQERFFQVGNNSDPAPSPYNYVWKIPFTYFTDKTEVTSMVITKPETRVTLPTGVAWYKANANQMGFYRVNYDDNNWNSIKGILLSSSFSKLSDSDRAGLMQDAFALSSAGLLDTEFALDLSKYLVHEEAYVPWVAAIEWLGTFGSRLSLTRVYGDYKCYVDGLLQPRVNALPFNRTDLDHLDVLLRSLVLRHSGAAEVDAIGRQLFLEWKDNNQTFDPNLKDFVYSRGIALGTTGDWDFMWELYMNSSDPYEKRLFMKALSFSNQPWILARYLEYSITKVRLQDTLSVISYISNNVIGRYLAWNFFRDNYDFLYEKFGGGSFSFARIIRGLTSAFSTELELKEVKDFFSEKPEAGSGTRAYLQTLEVIRGNIDWLNANLNLIEEWLSNN